MRRLERRGAVIGGARFYGIQPVGDLRPRAYHHYRRRGGPEQFDDAPPIASQKYQGGAHPLNQIPAGLGGLRRADVNDAVFVSEKALQFPIQRLLQTEQENYFAHLNCLLSFRLGLNAGKVQSKISMTANNFDRGERAILLRLKKPGNIQRFLDEEIGYNKEQDGDTCRSPRRVLRDRTAQCMEGALFAAAALRVNGHPPLLVDLEAVRDDDHVLAVFRERGHWGAVAKSNYAGLRFREPIYRTLRELVMSYFEHYYNPKGEKTLRHYSRPVNLGRFDPMQWMTTEEDLWLIPEYLTTISHTALLTPPMERRLNRMDRRLFAAGRVGSVV